MIQIKTLLKPKTAEGKRIKPTSPLKPAFFEQTLDKYHFQNNEKYSNPPFFYRHYYENSNIKNSSGNSQKFDIARAITSQSTKNSSRANFENFVSFLQTTENNPNERIKTQQSTLFAACQRRSGQNINNEISEESIYKERINTANGNITKNNAIFYERKKNDNKFFLPKTSTFSKKLKYILNEELVNKGLGEEKLDKAQAKFLQKKYFGDSNPDKFYMEKMNNNYSRENIVSNKSHNHLNVMKKIILKENFITDFQNEEDPFQKNEACKKKFKINSIIMKNPKEISHATLINSQIKPKLFVQKNITKASENNRMFLIIENLYLDEGKKNKLKYCYSQLNYVFFFHDFKTIKFDF